VKRVIKRPFIHYIIIAVYILAPVANLLGLSIFMKAPFSVIISNFFKGYGILAGIWLLTAPFVGIGFLFVHRVSWYVFIGHSSLILIDYIMKWAIRPAFYWQNIPSTHNFIMMTGNLVLVFVIGYIIQKDFRAPYFQALPRSWRESERIPINHKVMVDGVNSKVTDLSQGGCFVSEPGLYLKVGDKILLNFRSETLTIVCNGQVMRQSDAGFGIQFFNISARKKRDIRQMLKRRFSLRYEVSMPCIWLYDHKKRDAEILNISQGGCFLHIDIGGFKKGIKGMLEFTVPEHNFLMPATIVWINKSKEHDKPIGFGLQFSHKQRKAQKLLVKEYGKRVLTR
jgi:Tfp pilus assembly protein PilZ